MKEKEEKYGERSAMRRGYPSTPRQALVFALITACQARPEHDGQTSAVQIACRAVRMNLGQLVGLLGDLELLRQDHKPPAPAPCQPLGIVTHRARQVPDDGDAAGGRVLRTRPGSLHDRVRAVLAAANEPLSVDQVHAAMPDVVLARVRAALHQAATYGDVTREGPRGAARYTITEQGRTKVHEEKRS